MFNEFTKQPILPPIVQNCPNRLSDATRNPFDRVVIRVSLGPIVALAYSTFGKPTNGCDSGGYGVTIWSLSECLVEKRR